VTENRFRRPRRWMLCASPEENPQTADRSQDETPGASVVAAMVRGDQDI
jgi:hypothetical protein